MPKSTDHLDKFFVENHVEEVFVAFSKSALLLCGAAEKTARESGCKVRLHADRRILYKTVISAYYDIARYKQFHFSGDHTKRSDGVKRAAFFTKWTVRFRPIQCVFEDAIDEPEIDDAWVLMLNEHLALEWGSHCISNDFKLPGINLYTKFRNDLLYELHYREMNTDGLLAVYQMLSDTIKGKTKNPFLEIPVT